MLKGRCGFVDPMSADHEVRNIQSESTLGLRNALVVQDHYSGWLHWYPTRSKETEETMACLGGFMCMWFKITSQDGYNVIRQKKTKWTKPWSASKDSCRRFKKSWENFIRTI